MKTISIPLEIKELLDEFGNGKSVNKTMAELLEDVESSEETEEYKGKININMDNELFDKLKQCRLYSSEPYASVIFRLISEKGK